MGGRVFPLPGVTPGPGSLYIFLEMKLATVNFNAIDSQETYNLSDLKHDLHCVFVELGGSVSVSS